jgi:hypothetical protein
MAPNLLFNSSHSNPFSRELERSADHGVPAAGASQVVLASGGEIWAMWMSGVMTATFAPPWSEANTRRMGFARDNITGVTWPALPATW